MNPGYGRNSTIYWMPIQNMYCFWRNLSLLCKLLPPSWHYHWFIKKPFHCPIKTAASGWWGKFCEGCFLIRSNAVVEYHDGWCDAFCKSMGGSFNRSIVHREGKSVSKVFIQVRKHCPFHDGSCPMRSSWLITLGNCAMCETQWLSLLLEDLTLSSGSIQVCLGERKSLLLSPCITSIPSPIATLFMNSLDNGNGGWGERLTGIYRAGHSHSIIRIFLC